MEFDNERDEMEDIVLMLQKSDVVNMKQKYI